MAIRGGGIVRLRKIVSGGQTGVDRAALDVAAELGFVSGGWCPRGRRAEDGAIAPQYPLTETPARHDSQRTEWNVRDADATLVLAFGGLAGGTALTVRLAKAMARPCLIVRRDGAEDAAAVRRWLSDGHVETLNIAGPRESEQAGVHTRAKSFLMALLEI
jgi:predicted Rossmann-fold nucleotide-binding protein